MRWMEQAWLATDPLNRLLYLFFALECLLGDTSADEKAGLIALRRVVMSTAMGKGFVHPSTTYWLYDKVRSAAVHGSEPLEVSDGDINLSRGTCGRRSTSTCATARTRDSPGRANSPAHSTAIPTGPA